MWPSTAAGDEHHRHGSKAQSPNPNHAKDSPDQDDTHVSHRTKRPRTSIALFGISVDAVDAARLANFWAQALQRTIDDGATEDFASIAADPDSQRGPFLMFHKVPEGKTVKNRPGNPLEPIPVPSPQVV